MKAIECTVIADAGFAQVASLIVRLSQAYVSEVLVEYQGAVLSVHRSHEDIMDVMDLNIQPGKSFQIRVVGPDERLAIREIKASLVALGKLRVKKS